MVLDLPESCFVWGSVLVSLSELSVYQCLAVSLVFVSVCILSSVSFLLCWFVVVFLPVSLSIHLPVFLP